MDRLKEQGEESVVPASFGRQTAVLPVLRRYVGTRLSRHRQSNDRQPCVSEGDAPSEQRQSRLSGRDHRARVGAGETTGDDGTF